MQGCLPDHLQEVLDVVLSRKETAAGDVADALRIDVSTAHRHLASLARDGFLERIHDRKIVRYRPRARMRATYVGPLGTLTARQNPEWGRLEWDAHGVVDWRYPLVSRVPDEHARRILRKLLDNCWKSGLLTPWLTIDAMQWDEALARHEEPLRKRILDWLRQPEAYEGMTFVAYGSCARGDARADSDLDLLVIGPTKAHWRDRSKKDLGVAIPFWDRRENLERLVGDMNLGTPRHIDMTYIERSDFFDVLAPDLQFAIRQEGITVYSSFGPEFIESLRWQGDG